ncbi:rab3 GTPase-activating protein non-catalytic subunit [Patella vulgata]|uniref:rab3 GTPase-activating protein non-catalytic subunit n=1 Tax=Patella vulgata TaxID=6465 RepID=UPI0024A91B25|nr:rab3 GTPase-activating protein non-catalytic subunit [Patella vulgata]
MSCQLSVLSGFRDIKAVRQFLFPFLREHTPEVESANSVTEVVVSDEWNNDWGWSEDEQAIQKAVESLAGNNEVEDNSKMKWLQDCLISLSPANDMITLAFENRIIVLTQKWDPKNNEEDIDTKFTIAWKSEFTPSELITAVLCLPLASQKRSTHGAPDWTCVIVGYSNGYIKMFTETGVLLLSQLLHTEPIQKIKAHTYEPPRYLGMAEQHEELVILYRKAVVSIDGFSLMQSLRACRNQVARATASGGESVLQVPPLAYKKWGLQDQDIIHDHISCGLQSSNPFDQMKTASLLGGYAAGVKSSPPAATIYVTSGVGPYVGFFYAVEGSAPPILSEVAMAMAHKIKSALMSAASGWLGFGGKAKDDSKDKHVPKIEQATPLPLRFSLPDRRRTGNKIVLSPNSHYAAVTGSFGRVILIDVERGIAVRIWKGYRDAQVGWIMIREDDGHSGRNPEHSRVAQFLIIYAPRRGILEVWTAANGPRVAAFNVSKWCQLVCPSYGVMGLNNVTCQGTKYHSYQCALIDTDGVIKIIDIPFHLALSDKSSKRARDLHLLKKLKALLKETTEESEAVDSTITELILDIRIANIAKQGVERILAAKYLSPKFMKSVIKACIKKISGKGDINQDIDSRLFLRYCQSQDCLLQSYNMIQGFSTSGNSPDTSPECLCRLLGVTPSELESIQSSLDSDMKTTTTTPDKRVQFKDNNSTLPITSYLRCFECQVHLSDHDASKFTSISVIKSLSSDRRLALATFIFDRCICGSVSSSDLSVMLQDSNLPPDNIMNLLLLYWLSINERYIWSIPNLHHVIKSITAMTDKSDVLVDNNAISPWWQKVRDQCSHSDHIQSAYIAALTCKGVATEMLGNQTKAKDPDADTASCNSDKTDLSEWESLTVDMEHWNVLVKQLDDVLAISHLLQFKLPTNQHSNVTKLEPITVSVTKLLEGGRGSISEIVARYAMRLGLGPRSLYRKLTLVNNHTDDSSQQITETDIDAEEEVKTPLEQIQDQLQVLRERFPHSLENDILLSNCCWEYAAQWNREPEIVKNLELSVEYLKLVQNALLRQGVCSLLWHMFILKRFSAAVYLMDKVGKVPKERLCRKEVGMSDTDLLSFIGSTADVLQITMDANADCRIEFTQIPVRRRSYTVRYFISRNDV